MKFPALLTASIAAVVFLGACDRQPFEVTKQLHEPYQKHHGDAHHGDKHEGGHDKAAHGEEKKAH